MICHYYLTYRCNCSCEFCRIWQDESFKDVHESHVYHVGKTLDSLKEFGVKRIIFTGGEPLLREDADEIFALARQKGFLITLYTNGLLFPDRAKKIASSLDEIYISIDSPLEDEHNRIRGQECFTEALDSLKAAKNMGLKNLINFTITRESLGYLPEMVELAEEFNSILNINPVHHFGGLEGFEKISVDYILRYSRNKNVRLDRAFMHLLKDGGNDISSPICRVADNIITISPDNHMILPCFNSRQTNIPLEGDLKRILDSNVVKGYKKLQGRFKECAGCSDLDCISSSINSTINKYRFSKYF